MNTNDQWLLRARDAYLTHKAQEIEKAAKQDALNTEKQAKADREAGFWLSEKLHTLLGVDLDLKSGKWESLGIVFEAVKLNSEGQYYLGIYQKLAEFEEDDQIIYAKNEGGYYYRIEHTWQIMDAVKSITEQAENLRLSIQFRAERANGEKAEIIDHKTAALNALVAALKTLLELDS